MKDLWKKLGDVYEANSLVSKLFLRKNMYSLKMEDGGSIVDHLNAFNMIVARVGYASDKIEEEDHCMLLLCSLPDSWDHLIMAIRSTTIKFMIDEVVASLLFEEMRRKSSESTKEALAVRGI